MWCPAGILARIVVGVLEAPVALGSMFSGVLGVCHCSFVRRDWYVEVATEHCAMQRWLFVPTFYRNICGDSWTKGISLSWSWRPNAGIFRSRREASEVRTSGRPYSLARKHTRQEAEGLPSPNSYMLLPDESETTKRSTSPVR